MTRAAVKECKMSFGAIQRLLRADETRKSRLHTSNGKAVLSFDVAMATVTTLNRVLFNKYTNIPWLTYPSIRFLEKRLSGKRLFEFGSGSSTAWYADRCSHVFSVENNYEWFLTVKARLSDVANTELLYEKTDREVIGSISKVGGLFDAIVIDSQPTERIIYKNSDEFRVACLDASLAAATKDCLFVIDNTDANPLLEREIQKRFSERQILRFPGWVPGILHPNETTIII
jgi:hypothetical protein